MYLHLDGKLAALGLDNVGHLGERGLHRGDAQVLVK